MNRYVVFEVDQRVHIYDVIRARTVDTGLRQAAIDVLDVAVLGRLAAIPVSEQEMGGIDYNDDGDARDRVVHLFDLESRRSLNIGVSVTERFPWPPIQALAGHFLLRVDEADEGGRDLNGDGDADDVVLHRLSPMGSVANLGLAVDLDISSLGSIAAFSVSEQAQGATDLNSDGDAQDRVVHYYEGSEPAAVNTGLARLGTHHLSTWRRGIAFDVYEPSQGGVDLNGDGDGEDAVPHVLEIADDGAPTRFRVTNTRLALPRFGSFYLPPSGTVIVVPVWEAGQGGIDLNGDGLASSLVPASFLVSQARTRNWGRSVFLGPVGGEGSFAVLVREDVEGDLNGDGDAIDRVVHTAPLWSWARRSRSRH